MDEFLNRIEGYSWILWAECLEVIYEYFVIDVAENKLTILTEETTDRMFVKFDTFCYLIWSQIDMVEYVAGYDSIDSMVLSRAY